jgi:hypothetical protein
MEPHPSSRPTAQRFFDKMLRGIEGGRCGNTRALNHSGDSSHG